MAAGATAPLLPERGLTACDHASREKLSASLPQRTLVEEMRSPKVLGQPDLPTRCWSCSALQPCELPVCSGRGVPGSQCLTRGWSCLNLPSCPSAQHPAACVCASPPFPRAARLPLKTLKGSVPSSLLRGQTVLTAGQLWCVCKSPLGRGGREMLGMVPGMEVPGPAVGGEEGCGNSRRAEDQGIPPMHASTQGHVLLAARSRLASVS